MGGVIRNYSELPVCFVSGSVLVYSQDDKLVTKFMVLGFNEDIGSEFNFEVIPPRDVAGEFFLNFESSDCLRLGLDEYGVTEQIFRIVVVLRDTYDQEHISSPADVLICAKGLLLHKIELQATKDKYQNSENGTKKNLLDRLFGRKSLGE